MWKLLAYRTSIRSPSPLKWSAWHLNIPSVTSKHKIEQLNLSPKNQVNVTSPILDSKFFFPAFESLHSDFTTSWGAVSSMYSDFWVSDFTTSFGAVCSMYSGFLVSDEKFSCLKHEIFFHSCRVSQRMYMN